MDLPRSLSIVEEQYLSLLHSLTPKQKKYFSAIRWLVDHLHDRRSGRTHVLALAFFRTAMEYPGMSFKIWDHVTGKQNVHNVGNLIRGMLLGLPRDSYSCTDNSIRITGNFRNFPGRKTSSFIMSADAPNVLNDLIKVTIQAIQEGHSIEKIKRTVNEGIVASTLEE